MDYAIVDAHTHLWLKQDAIVEGKRILTLDRGRSEFMGETVQMLPPFMTDGQNTVERLLANMDYARVGAAVVTQEFIDGDQNVYLLDVQRRYPDRIFCCGLVDMRTGNYVEQASSLIDKGFRAIKIPAHRLLTDTLCIDIASSEAIRMYKLMEANGIILSIDLAEGDAQVGAMKDIIAECPELKIAIGHFGMVTRPRWMEQIKLALHSNVYIESGGITWLFNEEFYPFDGAMRSIREAADAVGIGKLMWGSDYPRTIVAITYKMSYDFVVKSGWLTDEEKAGFLGLNAMKFYGFRQLPSLPYIKNMSE